MKKVKRYPNLEEIRLRASGKISLSQSEYVIYFLFNNEELIYIGQTRNLLKRISVHKRTKVFDKISIVETDYKDVMCLEQGYIKKYKPIYNTTFEMMSQKRKGHRQKGMRY
jgi:hypothetical protein